MMTALRSWVGKGIVTGRKNGKSFHFTSKQFLQQCWYHSQTPCVGYHCTVGSIILVSEEGNNNSEQTLSCYHPAEVLPSEAS